MHTRYLASELGPLPELEQLSPVIVELAQGEVHVSWHQIRGRCAQKQPQGFDRVIW